MAIVSESYSLILAFDSDDSEFVRGFEAGRLYEQLKENEDDRIEQTIHTENTEMAIRMAETFDRMFSAHVLDDNWVSVTFLPKGAVI